MFITRYTQYSPWNKKTIFYLKNSNKKSTKKSRASKDWFILKNWTP